ncbi:MAG: hybrid sensor histidine kinase/response regulator [Magnetococcales bacterium]|nr:hybrid sensor histidine kinase/response regulator [Magnetococcales bacterium]
MERQAKILIVDDEVFTIESLVGLLSAEYTIMVAKSGEQAWRCLKADNLPDLILLDILMPEVDGFEVCRRLKENKLYAGIPVIFITGITTPAEEIRGLELGAMDFIRKPFNAHVVLTRVRTHLELHAQKQRLVELNALKNRFLGMAVHDLRNPINCICGLSEMLLHMELAVADQRRFASTIHEVGHQMSQLINDLLDISVIESGHFDMNLTSGNLEALVQSRMALFRFAAEKKSITLMYKGSFPGTSRFDEARLAQAIDNLIGNAIKFSPPGKGVEVRVGRDEGGVWLAVADEGPGIAAVDRDRLFGAFQKLSARPTAKEKSTGLGLAIVKKIVDGHRGEIRLDSEPGQGAVFTIRLPDDSQTA